MLGVYQQEAIEREYIKEQKNIFLRMSPEIESYLTAFAPTAQSPFLITSTRELRYFYAI